MMKKLYGVDVFSGEGKDILIKIPYDFAIVKVSGNPQEYSWNYVNPYASRQAKDCINKTGLLGLYHFTWGKENPNVEADFFIKEVRKMGYLGKAMLVIDYEAQAVKRGRTWVKKFADRIKGKTGVTPVIYASSSVIKEQSLGKLGYPIWCANYYKGYNKIEGYDTSGCKIGYSNSIMWQFTSTGRLKGYNGNLDLNVFFGDEDDFRKYYKADEIEEPKKQEKKKSVADIAKEVMAGKWGDGPQRRKKLQEAGYNFAEVQKKVNDLVYDQLAKEVFVGVWGNGVARKNSLLKAGYNYDEVQKRVNKLVKK